MRNSGLIQIQIRNAKDGPTETYDRDNGPTFAGGNPFATNAKLISSTAFGEYLIRGDTTGPVFMEVMLTNKCNMACAWCITGNRGENGSEAIINAPNAAQIEIGNLERFLVDFVSMGGRAITYSGGGEPTYYKDFERAVKAAKSHGLDLGLMTNAVYPPRLNNVIGKNMNWMRISLDTLDAGNYHAQKGLDGVAVVKRNVETLTNPEADYKVRVGLNCNVGDYLSLDEVKGLVEYLDQVPGLSYLQFRPILPRFFKEGEEQSLNENIWEYLDTVKDNPKIILSNDKRFDIAKKGAFQFDKCRGHFFQPILDADQEVKVCSYHPERNDLTFGNIGEHSFKEIWASDQRKKAIETVEELNYAKVCQACCKLSENNRLLDMVVNRNRIPNVNFL